MEFGKESKTFRVHKQVLIDAFETFRDKLESVDEDTKPLILNDVIIETFETVSIWIYNNSKVIVNDYEALLEDRQLYRDAIMASRSSKTVAVASEKVLDRLVDLENDQADALTALSNEEQVQAGATQPDSESGYTNSDIWYMNLELGRCGKVIARLVDVYLFGTFHYSAELRCAAILQLQRFMTTMSIQPSEAIVKYVIDKLGLESPLSQMLANDYGHRMPKESMDKDARKTLSRAFLIEVLAHAQVRLNETPPKAGWYNDFCNYHEHSDEKERKDCRNSRRGDHDEMRAEEAAKKATEKQWKARHYKAENVSSHQRNR